MQSFPKEKYLLRQRLLSAFIIITCSLGFVALDAQMPVGSSHGFWMTLLAILLYLGSAVECSRMLKHRYAQYQLAPGLIGCGGIMLATMTPMFYAIARQTYPANCPLGPLGLPLVAAMIALVACFVWIMPSYTPGTQALERAMASGWVAVYFGIGFAFWVAMRQNGSNGWGLTLVVGMIVVTKFTDAGAYFSGRAFGRTKLCPAVSPGKTLEGLVGGMIVGVIVSLIYFQAFATWLFASQSVNPNWLGPILLGIALTFTGLAGDLLESIVKRETQCKDSSNVFPGLGGLWDVTDSLLPAGVVGYLIVAAKLISQPP
ncbi:MAG: phosphatidate cytidylyltransferase [Pirellulaceae bacterium]|nr:phosphatidate cytidylyltransferase [Pirellulaceae bacterium]